MKHSHLGTIRTSLYLEIRFENANAVSRYPTRRIKKNNIRCLRCPPLLFLSFVDYETLIFKNPSRHFGRYAETNIYNKEFIFQHPFY